PDEPTAYAVNGTERGHRLREDECDLRAADRPHFGAVGLELREVDHLAGPAVGGRPAKPDLALHDPARPIDDPQDGSRRDALAAPALPDDPQRRPWRHIEACAIDRLHQPLVLIELPLQIPNGQQSLAADRHILR